MKRKRTKISRHKLVETLVGCLLTMQLALFPLSWLITLINPSMPVKSMISDEGMRWLCGKFVSNIQQPLLVYLILAAFAWGILSESGLKDTIKKSIMLIRTRYGAERRKAAMPLMVTLLAICLCTWLLVFEPPTALLGIDGGWHDSALSRSVVPFAILVVNIVSIIYGIQHKLFNNLGQILSAFYKGLYRFAPIFLLYLLASQLYFSVLFVFFSSHTNN